MKRRRFDATPFLFLAPVGAVILFVYAYPIFGNLYNSFHRSTGTVTTFVGLENFKFLLTQDTVFGKTVMNNLTLMLTIPILVVLSVLIAILLYEQIVGWKLFRVAIFIPYVLSITVAGVIFSYVFRLNGILNFILENSGFDFLVRDWLGSADYAIWAIMVVIIWRELGFGVILFLARLLSAPQALYEVAKVEGASWWQTTRFVSIPQLRGVIEYFIVLQAINLFSWVFNYVYVMTGGGPGRCTYVLELYVYNLAFRFGMTEMASAVSVVIFVVVSLLLWLTFGVQTQNK